MLERSVGRPVILSLAAVAMFAGAWAVLATTDPDDGPARAAPNATGPEQLESSHPRPPVLSLRADVYAATEHGLSRAVAGDPERVYVPNSQSASIDVVDPATFRVVARYPVGSYPEHITPSWDLRRLYVDNTYGNSLTVIDPRTGRPTGRVIRVPDPYNLFFTPDGSRAIVVAERDQRLDVRNPRTWRLVKSVPIPAAGPDHLDFSANGRYFLLTTEFSGEVFGVSTTSMRVIGALHVGGAPIDVRLSPDGTVFYVANQRLGGVSRFLRTGNGAHGLAISRDKFLYVSNRLGTISVIELASRRVLRTWRVGGSPHGLAFFPQPGRFSVGHNGVYR